MIWNFTKMIGKFLLECLQGADYWDGYTGIPIHGHGLFPEEKVMED